MSPSIIHNTGTGDKLSGFEQNSLKCTKRLLCSRTTDNDINGKWGIRNKQIQSLRTCGSIVKEAIMAL